MIGFDRWNVKKPHKITPILLAVLLLSLTSSAEAALLCSESGPDSADDYLELSDFEVTGPEPLRVGDTVTVSFTLKAIEVPVQFGEQGAFVAVKDPDGIDRNFGHAYRDHWLQVDESISVKASTTVDKEGEWTFWPSYHIKENSPYYYGEHFAPDEWHACYLTTSMKIQPDLTVEEIFWNPSFPEIGEPVTVAVVVRNSGASSSEWGYLMLWGCCDLNSQVRPMEPDETITIYFEPITFEEPGEFEITATIDAASEIAESNEANNERSKVITVEGVLPPLSVSIFTDPVPSGESNEVAVRVTSNGDPVPNASVYLSATIGDLDPDAGSTDDDGRFVSTFTAPAVLAETRYTIYAEAAAEGELSGEESASDLITVPRELSPTAHIRTYPNPADEGESVTLEGWGEDEDGEVVEFRWTFPDGTNISDHGDSSELTLEPGEVVAGVYRFTVRDDHGLWSKVAEFELPVPPPDEGEEEITPMQTNFSRLSEYISAHIADPAVLAVMIVVLAAGTLLMLQGRNGNNGNRKPRYGSIHATSDPSDAAVFVDMKYKGRSPKTVDNVLIGPHTVLFLKRGYFGYEKNAVVVADLTTPAHRDLTKIPEVKLKLSADPAEIVADRESRSIITIEILTKDDNEIPIPVPNDTTVILETDIGAIESPVKIPHGRASVTSALISTSPASRGTATVKAEAEYGKIVKLEGSTTVEFMDTESD